ncbi:MAG TPA: alpha-2-macroglobulin family protein, partial [Chitinophagaceae bacterium]|nr:alpha-2-macroglobulin family protein [Chitinophagaceae bacterium]
MRIKPLRFFIACVVTLSIGFSLCGQIRINNYDKEWKQVDAFMRKGLPKSALTQVTRIYQLAKKDKQEAQVIKSLIYITGLRNEVTENDTKVIADLEKETTTATESAKSILNSLLAELYWQYFQQHRWQLYNRTNTEAFRQEDIATWTADDLHKKIGELYLRSIKNSSFLQQAKLTPYDAIISKGNVRHLRPTLFDLLAHRALDYFKNDERNITKPAYAFEINQPSAFDPAADFIHHKFETKDSLSLQQKALLLYQQLISFHLNDAKPDALIDVDIERIEFVNEKGVQENKKELYLLALNHITHQYENIPAASQASYLVAAQYNEDANSYQPYGDTLHRYDRVKAKEICEKILSQNDSSEGKINCYNLLNEINKKDLQFSIEKVNIPGQPFRALIQYKNTSQLYLRLVKADGSLKNEPGYYYEDKFWNRLTTAVPVRSWDQGLPGAGDFQKHSAEIKINALPAGSYFLLASTEKNFSVKNSLLGARRFYVSNISFINNGPDYFLLHRETGQPLVNASVQVWEEQYDYKTSKSKNVRFGSYNANELGFFSIELPKEQPYGSHEFQLDISYGGEHLFMSDNLSNYYYYPGGKTDNNAGTFTFLFTDRSIYRPGQTMFFKGLVINRSKRDRKDDIRTTFETMIYLRNANHELIDSLKVTTNDYGSFSGRFQLPQSGLNGEYTLLIRDGQGSANISVEEYKRPKFYVDYENLKETYKVNDKIKVTGFAKAYAGNNIDNATVVYRVVRQPRFIYDWLFWRWWQPPTREMEIVHGEIKTGTDGKFEIEFAAIPDLTIDKKFDPVFDYRIYADVTDINGETRSGESLVSVSYKSLLLEVIVPEKLPVDTLKNITISTTNMAGEFQPASVTVTISKLKEETRLIRARFWQRPDQFVMSKEEYIKLFPYDEYDNETDRKSWAKEKQVFEKTDSSRKNTAFTIKNTEWVAGYYLIEVTTKDKDGQEVKNVKYVELYDDKSNKLERPAYLWTDGSKPIEPGEKTTVRVGTSAENIYLIQQTDRSDWDNEPQTANYKQETLNNEKKTFEFSATESDRGGYGVNYFFVKNNRFYQFADVIKVPWTNKDLKIEYATFREKTLPGSEEKWKVKITGYKNEKVAAEMLASMYDASLDQFRSHNWYNPSLWPTYLDHLRWIGNYNFASIESDQSTPGNAANKLLFKEYDRIVSALYYNNSFSMGYGNSPYYNPYNGIVVREAEISANAAADTVALTSVNDPSKVIQYKVVKAGTRKYVDYRNKPDSNVTAHNGTQQAPEVQIRKNFNETAFFFPDLYTDSLGAVEFSFTVPEALTKWKLQTFAQTKDLAIGLSTKEVVTQKQLMVQPNAPRFFREGDRMEFSAKVVNLTDSEFTGQAQLQLFDATTNQSVDGWFQNMFPNQYFTVAAGQSEVVKFPIQIPYLFNKALTWRVVARAGAFSDGEEDAMPVLTNKTLVTETLPLNMKGSGKKNFRFEKLLNSSPIGGGQEGASETLQNYSLSVEYTTNPAWYAIQALPYLMEYPYECAEQTWNRYYANSLAGMIANSSPRIKQIFLQWANSSKASPVGEGLVGALHKNQE